MANDPYATAWYVAIAVASFGAASLVLRPPTSGKPRVWERWILVSLGLSAAYAWLSQPGNSPLPVNAGMPILYYEWVVMPPAASVVALLVTSKLKATSRVSALLASVAFMIMLAVGTYPFTK